MFLECEHPAKVRQVIARHPSVYNKCSLFLTFSAHQFPKPIMKSLNYAISLLALSSYAAALNVVSVSIQKVSNTELIRRGLSPRATITESILNNASGGSYMANVNIGTPPQAISLVIDTGSSDVFSLSYQADECTNARLAAKYGGCTGGLCKF